MDLFKHSLKVILNSLEPGDKFGLVSRRDTIDMTIEPIEITEENKEYYMSIIDSIETDTDLNMWSALKLALKESRRHNNVSILLITDNTPDKQPILGYEREFLKYPIMVNNTSVHVFAYGHVDMDVDLLFEISKKYNGTFNYIPNYDTIQVVIINSVANIFSHACMCINCPWNANVSGQLNYGQPRHFIIPENPDELFINNTPMGVEQVESDFNSEIYNFHRLRSHVVDMFEMFFESKWKMEEFKSFLNNLDLENFKAFKDDMKKIMNAIHEDNYDKWGKYYIRSWYSCHKREWKNNNTDKSIQSYGCGNLFNHHMSILNKTYEELKPY